MVARFSSRTAQRVPKLDVAGSTPVARSTTFIPISLESAGWVVRFEVNAKFRSFLFKSAVLVLQRSAALRLLESEGECGYVFDAADAQLLDRWLPEDAIVDPFLWESKRCTFTNYRHLRSCNLAWPTRRLCTSRRSPDAAPIADALASSSQQRRSSIDSSSQTSPATSTSR